MARRARTARVAARLTSGDGKRKTRRGAAPSCCRARQKRRRYGGPEWRRLLMSGFCCIAAL